MLVVVVLNAVSFFVVMGSSFFWGCVDFWELQPLNRFSLAIVGHLIFGGLAEVTGV